jgi:hypothetical protein
VFSSSSQATAPIAVFGSATVEGLSMKKCPFQKLIALR